jgi:hypothetical protein
VYENLEDLIDGLIECNVTKDYNFWSRETLQRLYSFMWIKELECLLNILLGARLKFYSI